MGFVKTFLLILAFINFYSNITFTCSLKLDNHEESRSFIGLGTHTSTQRSCTCTTTTFCSCCEVVKILYTFKTKKLCFNMIFEGNVLNVDLSLDALVLNSMTVASNRPFKMCGNIPGVLFSTACVTVTEISRFTGGGRSSVTVCPRFELSTKKETWNISYRCSVLMPNGTAGTGSMVVVMMPGGQMPMVPGVPMTGAPMPGVPMTGAPTPGAPMPGGPMIMMPGAPMIMMPGAPMTGMVQRPAAAPTVPAGAPAPAAPAGARPPGVGTAPPGAGAAPTAPMPAAPGMPPAGARPPTAAGPAGAPPAPGMGGAPPAMGSIPAAGAPTAPRPPAPGMGATPAPGSLVPAASSIIPRVSPLFFVMMNQDLASALESAMPAASASEDVPQESRESVAETFDSGITMLESQTDPPNASDRSVSNGDDHNIDLRNGRENFDQNSKMESTTKTEEKFKNYKRKKRNYDIFDLFHQSNRCERAYRICVTRSKHYIVSRLRNTKQNAQIKNDCDEKFVKIVHDPDVNLCTPLNLNDNTAPPQVTHPPLESQDAIIHTDDTLDAIVIQDEYSEGSDFHPQNNQYPIPLMTYSKAEMYPSRIPPVALGEELSRSTNDSIILKENLKNLNSDESKVLAIIK